MLKLNKNLPENSYEYRGIEFEDFPDFEKCFNIRVTVCELIESGSVIPRYHPSTRYNDKIYLNVFNGHLSLITNFSAYAHKFQCSMCDRQFITISKLKNHLRVCSNATKYKLPGGIFKGNNYIFDDLEQLGIVFPSEENFFPWFIVYEKIVESNSPKLVWTRRHQPISVSISSNVPGYASPHCIIGKSPENIIDGMLEYINQIREKCNQLAQEKWGGAIARIEELLSEWKPIQERDTRNSVEDGDNKTLKMGIIALNMGIIALKMMKKAMPIKPVN